MVPLVFTACVYEAGSLRARYNYFVYSKKCGATVTFWNALEVVQQLIHSHLGQMLKLRVPTHLLEQSVEL